MVLDIYIHIQYKIINIFFLGKVFNHKSVFSLMNILIKYKGKRLNINVKKLGKFSKGIGLMFKNKNSENLLFEFAKDVRISIHSFFVFFPFLIVWLDSKNRVLEYKIVKPFSFYVNARNNFRKFVEIPLNKNNEKIIETIRD